MQVQLPALDERIIHGLQKISGTVARLALFVVFFWFGILKVFSLSPASPLVLALLERTIPFMDPHQFLVLFGAYEMVIGLTFILPGLERIALAMLAVHMIMTFGPLVLLPEVTWSGFMVPTMEGQYIIKNLVIMALALGIAVGMHPMHRKNR
jgi:uncharacterized membrane protein YkgB